MKKKVFMLLCAMTVTASLAACGTTNEAPVVEEPQQVEETVEETEEEATEEETEEVTEEVVEEAVEAPVITEDFEGETNIGLQRGDTVELSVVDDGKDGTKALLVSGRTDSWNGVNFDANVFRGNKIIATTYVKSTAKSVALTIQYDIDGVTAYNGMSSAVTGKDDFVILTGKYTIPEDAENIFVYIESSSTEDILVDDVKIEADGAYKVPGEIKQKEMADTSGYASLKDVYADSFEIGICVNPATVSNEVFSEFILKEFSSVTCENNMKPEAILKKDASMEDLEGGGTHLVVDMSSAQAELDFAKNNGLKMRGHTLVWHSQTPDWIFYVDYDTNGELASRELMLTRLDNYMNDVFTWAKENYADTFYAWDIVNEAMEDNGKMRDSLWYQTIGEDYVEQAFAAARKYAPDSIKLFYNDYNAYQSAKQNAIIEMLAPVAKAGNIDGVGMQGHLYTGEDPEHFAKCAKKYADELGVVVHVTEIDVTMPEGGNPEGDQGKYYGQLFKALKDAKAAGVPIESVSVWGLTDSMSWKSNEKPLLFNSDLSGKNAFFEVIQAGQE